MLVDCYGSYGCIEILTAAGFSEDLLFLLFSEYVVFIIPIKLSVGEI